MYIDTGPRGYTLVGLVHRWGWCTLGGLYIEGGGYLFGKGLV